MVVEILVTQREAEHALRNEFRNRVLDQQTTPMIDEALGEPSNDSDASL